MKNTLKLAVITFLLFATTAFAQTTCEIDPDWSSSQVQSAIEECKKLEALNPEKIAKQATAYSEIAQGVAEALGTAAQELGVATNDFIKTDAGKLTIALIVWHVAGDDIKGVVFGTILLPLTIWFFFALSKRIRHTGEYVTVKTMFGERSRPVLQSYRDTDSGDGFAMIVLTLFCIAIVIISLVHILG